MAISRRLRFEILRRDGHACRYCGVTAPDAPLTVDHVIPVALGGSDEPDNLVTACRDCNAGKSSIAPTSEMVADVAADAIRWRRAVEEAALEIGVEREAMAEWVEQFRQAWQGDQKDAVASGATGDLGLPWSQIVGLEFARHSTPGTFVDGVLSITTDHPAWATRLRMEGKQIVSNLRLAGIDAHAIVVNGARSVAYADRGHPLPEGWQDSIERFLSAGLPAGELVRLARAVRSRDDVDDPFRYFCGAAWRMVGTLHESARRILEAEDAT